MEQKYKLHLTAQNSDQHSLCRGTPLTSFHVIFTKVRIIENRKYIRNWAKKVGNTVKSVLKTTYVKRSPVFRDHIFFSPFGLTVLVLSTVLTASFGRHFSTKEVTVSVAFVFVCLSVCFTFTICVIPKENLNSIFNCTISVGYLIVSTSYCLWVLFATVFIKYPNDYNQPMLLPSLYLTFKVLNF